MTDNDKNTTLSIPNELRWKLAEQATKKQMSWADHARKLLRESLKK